MIIIITLLAYFAALLVVSRLASRRSDNAVFFSGERRSPWYAVAFGMVGASISGVTFVSVPGMVLHSDMTYLQTCLGFIPGYFLVATVLLPLYYRLNLTSVYSFLSSRLGRRSHLCGSWFFLLSKMTGAAVRFYVVCIILQHFVLDAIGVPFVLTVVAMVALIWLYTRAGGIHTLVRTDVFQTFCMLAALLLILYNVVDALGMSVGEAVSAVASDSRSRIFVFDDPLSPQYFWKQFLSGIFIVVVMTGLDQDMMQKNLTCRNLGDARKDMCSYAFAFVPVNLLFLSLGVLLALLAARGGTALPAAGDDLLPMFAASGELGIAVVVFFTIGIVAASFSSADSSLTALTTIYCVDIRGRADDERLRRRTHLAVCILFALFVLLFRATATTSVIDAIYILCSYTYGPLLGLFAFALFTHRQVRDSLVPLVAIASPLLCLAFNLLAERFFAYHFGYELLMLNGALTFTGLWLCGIGKKNTPDH